MNGPPRWIIWSIYFNFCFSFYYCLWCWGFGVGVRKVLMEWSRWDWALLELLDGCRGCWISTRCAFKRTLIWRSCCNLPAHRNYACSSYQLLSTWFWNWIQTSFGSSTCSYSRAPFRLFLLVHDEYFLKHPLTMEPTSMQRLHQVSLGNI